MAPAGVGQQDVVGRLDIVQAVSSERLRRSRRRLDRATPHDGKGQEVRVHLGHVGEPGLGCRFIVVVLLQVKKVVRQSTALLTVGALECEGAHSPQVLTSNWLRVS